MHEKTLLAGALTMTALGATFAMYKGQTSAATAIHSVNVDLDPRDANVTVDGVALTHPRGTFELRGALGHVFTVEVSGPLAQPVTTQIAITDIGAFPSRISLPPLLSFAPPPIAPTPPSPIAVAAPPVGIAVVPVRPEFVRDMDTPPTAGPVAPPRITMGALTVVCMPKCDQIIDNNVSIGPGHVFNRPVPAGRHVLLLSAPNGVRKNLVVEVRADETKEVRMSMDSGERVSASPRRGDIPTPKDRF